MVHISSGDDKKEKGKHRVIIDATAGAIAGCIARVITGPLDVIKIRFQVQLEPIIGAPPQAAQRSKYTGFGQALTTIVREEGVQGLWRGTVPGLLLTVPYTAVQFVALQQVRQAAAAYGFTANPGAAPFLSLASGALAGAAATVASYPFDLLRTTLAAQGEPRVYRNMWDAARGIVSQRGPAGLYSGLGVTLVEIMPYAALQFGLYDTLNALVDDARHRYQRDMAEAAAAAAAAATGTSSSSSGRDATQAAPSPSPAPSPAVSLPGVQSSRLQAFACGLLAGLLAKLVTHPLDVAKKRYQVAGLQRSLRYGARVEAGFAMRSLAHSLVHIYRTEGLMGLWKGSVPSIVKAAPSAAITFAAYDAVLAWLLVVAGEQQSKERQKQQQQQQQVQVQVQVQQRGKS
ncbi:hypothetical protein PLESTB_001774000 [Pleodorina starrii]|uniref:Uncharacterized protein n=1 Tax=Pleodorina starrii TaxID=330485 RepID=A0A9W6C0N2_9CHLO|nr:hypothetical protein PLESTM_000824200 [Pleodorina starrii]GLC61593.1 hypothetical protein PLESTB_001774000 [Pleodorina starrii]GLC76990.1 hypothetical protein PLESTF_001864600 [Pleodorina starrii]